MPPGKDMGPGIPLPARRQTDTNEKITVAGGNKYEYKTPRLQNSSLILPFNETTSLIMVNYFIDTSGAFLWFYDFICRKINFSHKVHAHTLRGKYSLLTGP